MSQVTDYIIDSNPRAEVRADLNAVLAAAQSLNSGTSAPSSVPGMFWLDSSAGPPWELNIRSHDDASWTPIIDTDGTIIGMGSGTNNTMAKWTPDGGHIGDSDTTDDGSTTTVVSNKFVVQAGDTEITAGSLGVGRAPTAAGDFFSTSNISVIIETTTANGFASLDLINDAQQWRMGVRSDDTWSVRDVTGAKQVLQINTSGDVEVPVGDITATLGDVLVPAGLIKIGNATTASPVIFADDLVIDFGAVSSGISVMCTTSGGLVVGDATDNDAGQLIYNHILETWRIAVESVVTAAISSTGLTLPKASGSGIKVDIADPTDGWADIIGDQFSNNTGATKPILTTYNGGVKAWKFGVGDEAYMSFHIPHDYMKGTDIFLHIHWSHTGTLVTGGTITFKATSIYSKGHNQAPFTSSPAVGTFVGTASTTQYQHIITEVQYSDPTPTGLEIDMDLLEPDGVIEMTFEVDANGITVSGGGAPDLFIHLVDIHYQTTGLIGTKDKVPDFYV